MAKALFGHVGGPDPRMHSEVRRLQQRIRDLESQVLRLSNENDALRALVDDGALLAPHDVAAAKEPVLA